jgi:hypothetical protein
VVWNMPVKGTMVCGWWQYCVISSFVVFRCVVTEIFDK